MKQKGILYTIASAVLFGITPLITTQIYAFHANSLTVVFYRSLFVVMILAGLCVFRHISFAITRQQLFRIALVSVLGSGLTTILLFASYETIDTGTATSLHFLYPIFVALMCRVVYKDHLGRRKLYALLLAFLGMMLFLMDASGGGWIGYLMAIASSITYAFYMVYLEKSGLAHMEPYLLSFYIGIFITLETLCLHALTPQMTFLLPLPAYLLLIALAIGNSFLAVIWLQKGILYLGSTTASLFCLFEPITSLLVGVLFLNESLTLLKLTGAFMIILALASMSKKTKKAEIAEDAKPAQPENDPVSDESGTKSMMTDQQS